MLDSDRVDRLVTAYWTDVSDNHWVDSGDYHYFTDALDKAFSRTSSQLCCDACGVDLRSCAGWWETSLARKGLLRPWLVLRYCGSCSSDAERAKALYTAEMVKRELLDSER